jgi:hypothetical protein
MVAYLPFRFLLTAFVIALVSSNPLEEEAMQGRSIQGRFIRWHEANATATVESLMAALDAIDKVQPRDKFLQ